MKNKFNSNGFSLLEVLVAVVILAVALASSYFSFSTTAANVVKLQDKTAATWVALNVINKSRLAIIDLPAATNSTNGSEKMFNDNWNWRMQVEATPNSDIVKLIVEVKKDKHKQTTTVATSYLYLPQLL